MSRMTGIKCAIHTHGASRRHFYVLHLTWTRSSTISKTKYDWKIYNCL